MSKKMIDFDHVFLTIAGSTINKVAVFCKYNYSGCTNLRFNYLIFANFYIQNEDQAKMHFQTLWYVVMVQVYY